MLTRPDTPPGPTYWYLCEVTFFRDDKTLKFEIEHAYNEGAIALAAKILEHARYNGLGEMHAQT